MTDVKPREFWILKTPGGEFIESDEPMNMDWTCCSKFQVIEKSAYDTLKEHNSELIKALDRALSSAALKEAPFYYYSEAIADAIELLTKVKGENG